MWFDLLRRKSRNNLRADFLSFDEEVENWRIALPLFVGAIALCLFIGTIAYMVFAQDGGDVSLLWPAGWATVGAIALKIVWDGDGQFDRLHLRRNNKVLRDRMKDTQDKANQPPR